MKFALVAVFAASIALAACRREEPVPYYEPMKLGGAAEPSTGSGAR
ncbi:MAG: hypothetical protein ACRCS9_07675 [Hyphomicrobium sp.]